MVDRTRPNRDEFNFVSNLFPTLRLPKLSGRGGNPLSGWTQFLPDNWTIGSVGVIVFPDYGGGIDEFDAGMVPSGSQPVMMERKNGDAKKTDSNKLPP